jgi:hypothetical protein
MAMIATRQSRSVFGDEREGQGARTSRAEKRLSTSGRNRKVGFLMIQRFQYTRKRSRISPDRV